MNPENPEHDNVIHILITDDVGNDKYYQTFQSPESLGKVLDIHVVYPNPDPDELNKATRRHPSSKRI